MKIFAPNILVNHFFIQAFLLFTSERNLFARIFYSTTFHPIYPTREHISFPTFHPRRMLNSAQLAQRDRSENPFAF